MVGIKGMKHKKYGIMVLCTLQSKHQPKDKSKKVPGCSFTVHPPEGWTPCDVRNYIQKQIGEIN